jgi:hypothetical protein
MVSDEPALRDLAEVIPSTSGYVENSTFSFEQDAKLLCVYEREGSLYQGGILFVGARAFTFRAESHSTAWHVGAYNRLVEVDPSPWLHGLLGADPRAFSNPWGLRHFMVYVESEGTYEIAAERFEQLTEVFVSLLRPDA